MEQKPCIVLAHVNPKQFEHENELIWFIGLQFDLNQGTNVDLTDCIRHFIDGVIQTAKKNSIYKPEMLIDAKYVKRKDLHQYNLNEQINKKRKQNCENENVSSNIINFVYY